VPDTASPVPDFTKWPSFPFEGDLRVKQLDPPVEDEPARKGEDATDCSACNAPDEAYIWVSERWRVRAMDRPTGLPMVLILESRSHLDLGDLPNLLAAELGVMTVRLERAVRSLDGVARVHVNRWGDGSAHLHMWFLARPYGRLQLRGTFLSLWDDILPPISEATWRENLALVAAWLAEFGGKPLAEPPRIDWQAPSSLLQQAEAEAASAEAASLALQSNPDDASVALAEAPADEAEPADAAPADAAPTGAGPSPAGSSDTGSSSAGPSDAGPSDAGPSNTRPADARPEKATLGEETPVGGASGGTPNQAAASQTPSGGIAAAGPPSILSGTSPETNTAAAAPADDAPPPAGQYPADPNAPTVDLARQIPGSQPTPTPEGRTVPAARSGDEPEARGGTKPEHLGAAT
jgi:hypothetical protein